MRSLGGNHQFRKQQDKNWEQLIAASREGFERWANGTDEQAPVMSPKSVHALLARAANLEGVLREVDRDLSALQTDLANGCSVEVAGRELIRTLQTIRKVTGDQRKGSEDQCPGC